MTPTHTRKRANKYRYYISRALVQGQPEQVGSISRVPALEIEALVTKSVRDQLGRLRMSPTRLCSKTMSLAYTFALIGWSLSLPI
jgi:hypothetical protein